VRRPLWLWQDKPVRVWQVVRVVSVCAYTALCVALFVRPVAGLFWLFKAVVRLLPITFASVRAPFSQVSLVLRSTRQAWRWPMSR
jgi:hypothetical protein